MNILISINNKFADLAINMLDSVHLHNADFLNVYLMYSSLTNESISKIKSYLEDNGIGKLTLMECDFSNVKFPIFIKHISLETYYRLYAPFLLPKDMDRILYLDCDIICNGSIKEFYTTDFENNIFVGTNNVDPDPMFIKYVCHRLDLPMDVNYINAGVLLINLPEYRKFATIKDINQFIKDNAKKLVCQDQDLINKMFYGKIKSIGDEINYQINHIELEKLDYDNKKLIHYLSSPKPWQDIYYLPFHGVVYYRYLINKGKIAQAESLIKKHIENAELNDEEINELNKIIYGK